MLSTSRRKLWIKPKGLTNTIPFDRKTASIRTSILKKLKKTVSTRRNKIFKKIGLRLITIMVSKMYEWKNIVSNKKKIRCHWPQWRIRLKYISTRWKNCFQWKCIWAVGIRWFPLARIKNLLKDKFIKDGKMI